MIREPFTGRRAERFDEVQVVMRRHCRTVPQVGRQQGQLGLDIGAGSVPAQQGIHGETMPKIVDPWRLSFRGDNAAFLKQRPEGVLQARAAISPSTPGGIPNEGRIRRNGEVSAGSSTQIAINLIGNATIDRKQAGFIEFRLTNQQRRLPPVVITDRQSPAVLRAEFPS